MAKWKIGDTVRLKSGGPTMTIQKQHTNISDSWGCIWFIGNDWSTAREHYFHAETLVDAAKTED